MAPHFLDPIVRHPTRRWGLQNASTQTLIASTVLAAFDRQTRNQGLLGRDALSADTAMVLAPCNAIHTCFMRFAIDIIFASRDGTILRMRRHVRPWRFAWRFGAFAVIELPAGSLDCIQSGHRLRLADRF